MPIFTRTEIATSVAALRQLDAIQRTDRAITEVAVTFHLSEETVAEIARDAAHAQALEELRDRQRADDAARAQRAATANLANLKRDRQLVEA